MPNGTCRFIVFDFDNHEKGAEATDFANTDNEWHKEVDALRKICEINGIEPLVERSRSGNTTMGIAAIATFLNNSGYKKKLRQNNTIEGFSTSKR